MTKRNTDPTLQPSRSGKTAKRRKLRKDKKIKILKLSADVDIEYPSQKVVAQSDESICEPKCPSKEISHSSCDSEVVGKKKQQKIQPHKVSEETLTKENEEEDRTIHTLERLMKINRKANKKKLPSSFALDGLDYILNVVNDADQLVSNEESDVSDEDSNDMPLEIKHNKVKFASKDEKDEKLFQKNVSEEDEVTFSESDTDLDDEKDEEENTEGDEMKESTFDHLIVDEKAQVSESMGKYIPPAQRALNVSDEVCKMKERQKRQMKGLLNRLSEANIQSICNGLENMYVMNSRAIITTVLTELVLDQFYTADPLPERLIVESAMVVAVVSNRIGQELVAQFLEKAVKKLNDLLKLDFYGEGKECNNIVQLICSLYQLNAIQRQVVMDIISIFLESFKEKDIELLVLMLKTVGFQLRKDDPIALKSIIETISSKSHKMEPSETLRTKYMLEVLTAIKNNNVKKILGYDTETINNRRKKVKMLCPKDSESFPDVTFHDLVDAHVKGRWWIVGSAWGGLPMLKNPNLQEKVEVGVSSTLVKAAKKLRMNTDIRRKIFYSVMSSQDYVEAFEKVLQIGLSGKQVREVSHVLVECCQKERTFNPFYFHLLNKFCHHDKQFVMSLQCSFWDRFKLLDSLSEQQVKNVAKLLCKLILSDAIPLSCLKVIEYSEIEKPTVFFLRNIFSLIATEAQSHSDIDKAFSKLSADKHRALKNGLRLFLQHFMLKDAEFMLNNSNIKDFLVRMDQRLDSQMTTFLHDDFN